jgi:hypothetical protein
MTEHSEPRMVWELRRGHEVLAQLVEDRLDWPWMHCELRPASAGWMGVWQAFTDATTSKASSPFSHEWDSMRRTLLALELSLHLVAPPPTTANDVGLHYLVHIGHDGHAWFRFSESPNVRNPRHPSGT